MLGKLYYLMAMALTELSDEQCTEVATAADSLLVGVVMPTRSSNPGPAPSRYMYMCMCMCMCM